MRAIQAAFWTAFLLVLLLIAYDLHRLANFFSAGPDPIAAALGVRPPPPETRAQRNERLRHEVNESVEDIKAMLAPTGKSARETPRPSERSAR